MNRSVIKTGGVILLVLLIAVSAFLFVLHRDAWVIKKYHPERAMVEHTAVTPDEQRIARRFADSTLPYLKHIGLVTGFIQTKLEVTVHVSGKLWNLRSRFFKESFLTGLSLYTKVQGVDIPVKIVDEENGRLYAQIFSPDSRVLYNVSPGNKK